jgi:hypothetical protein
MEHLIYSFDTEPHCSVHVYEWQYNRQSHRRCYKRSSPTQTFPINAVPVSGSFESGFFIPDALEELLMLLIPLQSMYYHGKTKCYVAISKQFVSKK